MIEPFQWLCMFFLFGLWCLHHSILGDHAEQFLRTHHSVAALWHTLTDKAHPERPQDEPVVRDTSYEPKSDLETDTTA